MDVLKLSSICYVIKNALNAALKHSNFAEKSEIFFYNISICVVGESVYMTAPEHQNLIASAAKLVFRRQI
jgi:hypothetical protein